MDINYRRCITCRKVAHRHDFFRIVRCHDTRNVCLDNGMGRSAYVCKTHECLSRAQKKNRMSRALKAHIPDEIFFTLNNRLDHASNHEDKDSSQ
ncbi:MAG: YlxR family protein [Cyanobacteria bacterium P01_E01_bin.6]